MAADVFTTPVLAVDGSAWDSSSLLIRIDPDQAGPSALADLHAAWSRQPAREFAAVGGVQVVQLAEGVSVIDALAAYRAHSAVTYAEPNYRVSLSATPDDPHLTSLWGLHNTGQTGGTPDADIDALEAWGISTGGGNVIVAVIDTGVDYTHPDLAANMWVNAGEIPGDGIDNDGNGYEDDVHGYDFINRDGDPMDDHNHGTHVAGTIGAVGNNGLGVTGVAWNVQIMALKFLGADGSGSIADAIEALNYAVANGAQISNNSWGFNGQFSQALYDAIAHARDAGHLFVAAAGNGDVFGIGQNNDSTPFWPASYDLDNIVSVAAVDHNDQLAVFSNYGAASVDLAAPGVSILSTTRNGTYGTSSGTSMAAPHVSGVLALLAERSPGWTHQELIERVLTTVDPVAGLSDVTLTGGRLNAFEALAAGVTGPRVIAHAPLVTFDPVDRLRVRFSEPIDAATFTLEDIVRFDGPLGPIAVTAIEPLAESDGREFDIMFAEQTEFGVYELVFGPDI
ncbi:MAG TPA: S8 family peptidase, partial [Planctomycetaceae bacterium]|nr:S8 family peptidase [Planctomycetaceae bacterium]